MFSCGNDLYGQTLNECRSGPDSRLDAAKNCQKADREVRKEEMKSTGRRRRGADVDAGPVQQTSTKQRRHQQTGVDTAQRAEREADRAAATATERRRRRQDNEPEQVAERSDREQQWRRHAPQPSQRHVLRHLLALRRRPPGASPLGYAMCQSKL